MPSATAASSPCCWCFIPSDHARRHKRKFTALSLATTDNNTPIASLSALTLPQINNCSKGQKNNTNVRFNPNSYHNRNHPFFLQFFSSIGTNNESPEDEQNEFEESESTLLFANMWWADMKAALGQRINFEAILCTAGVAVKDPKLALPHISVPDIRHIDWAELHRRGFKGVVFDKDNTITAPYTLTTWPLLGSSLERCKSVFGPDIVVFSNSAGLQEYDHDDSKARTLENAIGIKVVRHRLKKPAGTAEEIEKHFGCESSQLIMVGDRPFTDIVYGNRNEFLTILTEPLSLVQEPFTVQQYEDVQQQVIIQFQKLAYKHRGVEVEKEIKYAWERL